MCIELETQRPILRLSWPWRIGLGLLSIFGTVFWAWSFRNEYAFVFMLAIAIGAGVAWLGLGAMICLFRPGNGSPGKWADVCLRTQATGIVLLIVAGLANLAGLYWSWEMHAVILICADALMAGLFVGQARRMNVGRRAAMLLWFGALHGFFVLTIWVFLNWGAQ